MRRHTAKVLIVGSGALGMVAAYTLEQNESEVTIVVRSGYEKASTEGYTLNSVQFGHGIKNWKPTRIVKDVKEAVANGEKYEYIYVSLKNLPDGPKTCEDIIEPAVLANPDSTIILCQNGIDIEKPMMERFPGHIILSAVSLIGCTNVDCTIEQMTPDIVQFGVFEGITNNFETANRKVSKWIEMYAIEGKNKVKRDANVRLSRWQKLLYNSAINTTTALVDLDCSRAAMAGCKETIWRPIMKEIYAIAKSDGYEIPPHLEESMLNTSNGLFYTPSMLIDVRLGRMIEMETIVGNPLKIAERNGVDAPHLNMMYNMLKMVQFRIKEASGLMKVDVEAEKKTRITYDDYGTQFE